MNPKIEIIQAKSKNNNVFLIHKFNDGNTHCSFDTYKLVKNKEVARDFGIPDKNENGKEENSRTMCERMIVKIREENLYYTE